MSITITNHTDITFSMGAVKHLTFTVDDTNKNTVLSGESGKRIIIYAMILSSSADQSVTVYSGTTTLDVLRLLAGDSLVMELPHTLYVCESGEDFDIQLSAAGTVDCYMKYTIL